MRTLYAPKGTHQVGKFGAIPTTDPDDISQSIPNFWPIFEFQALKIVGGRPIPSEVCISRRWSPSTKCEIFRGQRPLAPEIWAEIWVSEKVDWAGRNQSPVISTWFNGKSISLNNKSTTNRSSGDWAIVSVTVVAVFGDCIGNGDYIKYYQSLLLFCLDQLILFTWSSRPWLAICRHI